MPHLLSTRRSRRAIAVVAILLALSVAVVLVAAGPTPPAPRPPAPPPIAVPIAEAIERTVAEPMARVHLELAPSTGPPLTVTGVAGLATDDVDLSVTVGERDGGRYRIVGERAWIGADAGGWMELGAEAVRGSGAVGWRHLLRTLRADPGGDGGRARLDGHPATVELDGRGRVRRVRATLPRSSFDLRLDGYDDDLAIVPPP